MKAKIVFKGISLEDIKPGDAIAGCTKIGTLGFSALEFVCDNINNKQIDVLDKTMTYFRAEIEFDNENPIKCPCCGSEKTYLTLAIHCNHCAVTTETGE